MHWKLNDAFWSQERNLPESLLVCPQCVLIGLHHLTAAELDWVGHPASISYALRLFILRMELKSRKWVQHPNPQPCVSVPLQQPNASWSVMHPEQPKTGLALQGRQADSAPRGTLSTGLLQGLFQSARPPSFCFLLPRVHAADVAAAQPAQMPSSSSSSSTSPAAAPFPSASTMPSIMSKPEFPDTGWDRIKELFDREFVLLFLLDFFCFPLFIQNFLNTVKQKKLQFVLLSLDIPQISKVLLVNECQVFINKEHKFISTLSLLPSCARREPV